MFVWGGSFVALGGGFGVVSTFVGLCLVVFLGFGSFLDLLAMVVLML